MCFHHPVLDLYTCIVQPWGWFGPQTNTLATHDGKPSSRTGLPHTCPAGPGQVWPIKPALHMAFCGLPLGAEPGVLLAPMLGCRQWPLVLAARPGDTALASCQWLLWGQKLWWTLRVKTSVLWLSPSYSKFCNSAFWFSCDTGSTVADFVGIITWDFLHFVHLGLNSNSVLCPNADVRLLGQSCEECALQSWYCRRMCGTFIPLSASVRDCSMWPVLLTFIF
jgi:hypothetical protein